MPLTPWWRPEAHADRRPFLMVRGRIRDAARRYFAARDFVEVECGALQASPGAEAHLHAFRTEFVEEGGGQETFYLHTSPEFSCKKILAAGERRIFDFARVYRNRETGPLHAPEFTMLEWYRAGERYERVMIDCIALCREALGAADRSQLEWRGRACDPVLEPENLTLVDAFRRYCAIDLEPVLEDRDGFARVLEAIGVRVAADDTWSDLFSRVLVERIEPRLGDGRLTLLYQYPAAEAALARACPHDARFAERFELYACGVELANGFGELTDPTEQGRRLEAEMSTKLRVHGESYPLDDAFLAALEIMPEASGVALGFDRLVMLASGARHISDVIWTPFPERSRPPLPRAGPG